MDLEFEENMKPLIKDLKNEVEELMDKFKEQIGPIIDELRTKLEELKKLFEDDEDDEGDE